MTDEWEDYESGPFCRHWSDPADCEEVCVCGHGCIEHAWDGDTLCDVQDCDCLEWREKE